MSNATGPMAGGVIDGGFLRVLAVDDEPPALDELAYLLRADPRVAVVHTATDVTEAFRVLRDNDVEAVFLDIRMPGLDGMELARVLGRSPRDRAPRRQRGVRPREIGRVYVASTGWPP